MTQTITELKQDTAAALHGTSLNKINNFKGVVKLAARRVLNDVDFFDLKRKAVLTNGVCNSEFEYVLPDDVNGNRIINVRPVNNDRVAFSHRYTRNFDFAKSLQQRLISLQHIDGQRTLKINYPENLRAVITQDPTDWTVSANITKTDNTINYLTADKAAHLAFGAQAAAIEDISFTDTDRKDFSAQENNGAFFVKLYIDNETALTGVTLRWGNDTTNYYEQTVTTQSNGKPFLIGWNNLRFDWRGASNTGTPDPTALDYYNIRFAYDGTAFDAVFDSLVFCQGVAFELPYYSKYLFKDGTSGARTEIYDTDDDIILLENESYDLFFNAVVMFAARQMQSENSSFDFESYEKDYNTARKNYTKRYKSEILKVMDFYYEPIWDDSHDREAYFDDVYNW